jgi:3-phenylpropionate/trans-cinnamate dioxygenase ferredoxin reductase subunit
MEYHGYADPDSCRVVTRDLDEAAWMAFWLNGDRVAAGMHVNCWDDAKSVKDLVLDGAVVDADRLADRTVDWADVRAG